MEESLRIEREERFVAVSAALTGFDRVELLGTGVAALYLATLDKWVGADIAGDLLRFGTDPPPDERTVRAGILSDAKLGPVARNLMALWYNGTWSPLPSAWYRASARRSRTRPTSPRSPRPTSSPARRTSRASSGRQGTRIRWARSSPATARGKSSRRGRRGERRAIRRRHRRRRHRRLDRRQGAHARRQERPPPRGRRLHRHDVGRLPELPGHVLHEPRQGPGGAVSEQPERAAAGRRRHRQAERRRLLHRDRRAAVRQHLRAPRRRHDAALAGHLSAHAPRGLLDPAA